MLFTWNRWFAKQKSSVRKSGRGSSFKPVIEQLESRLAPTASTWTSVGPSTINETSDGGPNAAGRLTALAVDPNDPSGNTVYAGGAGGGVWETTDFYSYATGMNPLPGPKWTNLTDNLPALVNDQLLNPNVGSLAAVKGVPGKPFFTSASARPLAPTP